MATGDRIIIGNGALWSDEVTVPCYEPRWQDNGDLFLDHFGAAQLTKLGGVKGGTTGVIKGQSIKVHRTQLYGEEKVPTMGGMDLVNVFPVQLDHYMKVAWIPAHHLKVLSGGHGMGMNEQG